MPRIFPAAVFDAPPTRLRELAIVLCWLVGTAVAFAWHGAPHGTSEAPAVAAFDPAVATNASHWLETRAPRPARGAGARALTLVHLREPGCRCNPEADRRLEALRGAYAARGVQVLTLPVGRRDADRPRWLTATPAAALLAADGSLLYLGPLEIQGSCARGTTPVRRALESALAGSPSAAQPLLGTGCFCS